MAAKRKPRALIEVECLLVIDGFTPLYAVPDADGGTLHVTVPED
jgi:hypothetical protein